MHHQRVLQIILWLLVTQVSSGIILSYCKTKEKIVLNPIINHVNQPNQLIRIHNDVSKLTDYQKTYAEMFYPTVWYHCRGHPSSKHITRLIVMYLAPPLPTSIHTKCALFDYKISFDDQWLATYAFWDLNKNSMIILWRLENGTRHATLDGHRDEVNDLMFTSDNQYLISASDDTTLMIWSVCTGHRLHTFRGHTERVMSCSLTRNNQQMVSTSDDYTIRIWFIETGECAATICPSRNFCITERPKFCNHDQHMLISKSRNGVGFSNIQLWAVTGTLVWKVYISYNTRFLALDEVRFLITDIPHNTVQVWEFASETCLQTLWGHADCVHSAFFVQEKTGVVSCDINDTYIWRVADGICTHQFHNYALLLRHRVNPMKYWLEAENTEGIIVNTPNAVHILAVNSGEILFTFPIQTGQIWIQVSFDGRFLVWKDGGIVRFLTIADHKNITHN